MQQVLVIDDDIELCELVAEYLEPDGYQVEAVHDGEAGLERALSGEHALVVLDYMLPSMNGFEVLRQIRVRSRLPSRTHWTRRRRHRHRRSAAVARRA